MILIIGLSKLQHNQHVRHARHVVGIGVDSLFQQDIFRFQVAVYQLGLPKQGETSQQLLGEHAHKGRAQSAELVLLDELVKIDTQQLEHQTQVLSVNEGVLQP